MRSVKISAWYLPVIELSGLLTTALAVGIGGWWVHTGALTHRHGRLLRPHPLEPVRARAAAVASCSTSCSRPPPPSTSSSSCSTPPSTWSSARAPSTCPTAGDIDVAGVGFAYAGGEPVLRDVDLAHPGGRAPGPRRPDRGRASPPWPSSIARLYDPTEGSVRFGGVDLRDATAAARCASRVVVVPQEGFLFNGTILREHPPGPGRRHRRRGRGRPARPSGVDDRFARLPEGLHTEVRERGSRLSRGGEAAGLPGPGRPGRPGRPRARRGHLEPRPRHRGGGRAGHGRASWRAARSS